MLLPDFQSKNELNDHIISEISLFIRNCCSKNLLVILDQVNSASEVFQQICDDKKLNLYFSSTEKIENCDKITKLFDLYIPLIQLISKIHL